MACLVCSEVQSESLEKRKGNRPTGVKEALNSIYTRFVASRNGSSTTLATRRAPERKPIPTRSHFGYFIPEPLNTSCDTRAIDRVGPNANGRFWCVRRGGVDAVGLLRDAAVVFSVQPFSELVRQPLRLNTQPNAFQPHTHQPSDNARWRRFVAEWTEWVTGAFLEQRAILWPSQSHTQIHFIDVSSPSALMSRDGCERQTDHMDFEKGVDDAFSIIAVFGCHPRLFTSSSRMSCYSPASTCSLPDTSFMPAVHSIIHASAVRRGPDATLNLSYFHCTVSAWACTRIFGSIKICHGTLVN